MRILVCGSRHFNNYSLMANVLIEHMKNGDTLIHGCCGGADIIAEEVWNNFQKIERYPANWDKYGRAAGPIRNKQMLDEGKPDLVIAFLGHVAEQEIFYGLSESQYSRGTKDMIRQATKAGVPVKVINI